MDPLSAAMKIAGSGLEAQSKRLRIVSENIANARSTGDTPGAEPPRRKTITFGQ
ncbi:flagellar basal body protein, partial [Rhizobium johnstonii]|uniref:flagellar basal body protein n=1 Tax=Rhizobium johnstonii TaxID=3019933 RepID=UPI003F97A740